MYRTDMGRKNPLLSDIKEYLSFLAQSLAEWVLNNCVELKMNKWTEMLTSWLKASHIEKMSILAKLMCFIGKKQVI